MKIVINNFFQQTAMRHTDITGLVAISSSFSSYMFLPAARYIKLISVWCKFLWTGRESLSHFWFSFGSQHGMQSTTINSQPTIYFWFDEKK